MWYILYKRLDNSVGFSHMRVNYVRYYELDHAIKFCNSLNYSQPHSRRRGGRWFPVKREELPLFGLEMPEEN